MKLIRIITIICLFFFNGTNSVRLHKMFQFIDGFKSEHNLRGFLHVGNDYAVFLQAPKPHDKYLIYELYEAKNVPEIDSYKPRMLAITKVPIEYMKDQLKTFRNELYKAKYVDDNIVPGTRVQSLREWQIERALTFHENGVRMQDKAPILRTIL